MPFIICIVILVINIINSYFSIICMGENLVTSQTEIVDNPESSITESDDSSIDNHDNNDNQSDKTDENQMNSNISQENNDQSNTFNFNPPIDTLLFTTGTGGSDTQSLDPFTGQPTSTKLTDNSVNEEFYVSSMPEAQRDIPKHMKKTGRLRILLVSTGVIFCTYFYRNFLKNILPITLLIISIKYFFTLDELSIYIPACLLRLIY